MAILSQGATQKMLVQRNTLPEMRSSRMNVGNCSDNKSQENQTNACCINSAFTCGEWKTRLFWGAEKWQFRGKALERHPLFLKIPHSRDTNIPPRWDCKTSTHETKWNTVPVNRGPTKLSETLFHIAKLSGALFHITNLQRKREGCVDRLKKKACQRQTVQAVVQMYKRWDRRTCTAIDEQTLVGKLQGTRTLNPQGARKKTRNKLRARRFECNTYKVPVSLRTCRRQQY